MDGWMDMGPKDGGGYLKMIYNCPSASVGVLFLDPYPADAKNTQICLKNMFLMFSKTVP